VSAPACSVIVSAFSEARFGQLVAAVESLRAQTAPPAEVVVVIDNNAALLERAIRVLADAVVVPNTGRRGLSGARNSGVARARRELVAFLDDDAEAAPDWLERLTAPYSDDAVAGVGGWIEPVWIGGRPGWFPDEFDWVVGCSYRGLPAECAPVRNVIGANMSFRRDVLEEVGGFRADLGRIGTRPLGCEETELCMRIGRRWPDRVLLHEPSARVFHQVPPERSSWRYFRARCYAEGLSKATVAQLAGARGLSSERSHALRVLPKGFARGLGAAAKLDGDALRRSFAIGAGLAITSAGYLAGRRRVAQGVIAT
jgi:glycosyltransferase involved in cell wall biosynthesis